MFFYGATATNTALEVYPGSLPSSFLKVLTNCQRQMVTTLFATLSDKSYTTLKRAPVLYNIRCGKFPHNDSNGIMQTVLLSITAATCFSCRHVFT